MSYPTTPFRFIVPAIAALLIAGLVAVAGSQRLGDLPRTDAGLGKIGPLTRDPDFRTTPASDLQQRRGVRLQGSFGGPREGIGWGYRFFGHPVPSSQYFNQPRTYRWSPEMFGRGMTRPDPGPGDVIVPPAPTIYNYYYTPRYYYRQPPPRYDPWCDCWHY